jgi:glycosyltransferase involved in cell wall biosynthesis
VRILHVVTLFTPDGTYGGPARVALNQTTRLQARGHDVQILASTSGFTELPKEIDGIPLTLFPSKSLLPGASFAKLLAPGIRPWLRQHATSFDVVHIHMGRDLVGIPSALELRKLGVPYVCQTHGMIQARAHILAPIIDRLWLTGLLQNARHIFCLNERERDDLMQVVGNAATFSVLANGIPRPALVGAAQQPPTGTPEVLFLSRVNPRKRPELFAEAAVQLLRRGVDARFSIVGPPNGGEAAVDAIIATAREEGFGPDRLVREGGLALDQVNERMSRASIYVLPALREPFGLTIAEALALAIPVVISDDGGLADFVTRNRCGRSVPGDAASVAAAIEGLLADRDEAAAMGRRGAEAVEAEFGVEQITDRLEQVYREASA